MKKQTRFLCIVSLLIVVLVTSALALTGCSAEKMAEGMYEGYSNLAENATFDVNGKTKKSFSLKGKEGVRGVTYVDLGEPKAFNTVVLKEWGNSVIKFNIYASDSKDATTFKHIYEGDTIEGYRVCYVGDVKYRYLRIDVASATKKYNVNDIAVYDIKSKDKVKRVCSYFILDRITHLIDPVGATPEQIAQNAHTYAHQFDALDTVSDLILFGMTDFDVDGNVLISDTEVFERNLALLKKAVDKVEKEQNRKINLIIDIFMPERHKVDPNAGSRTMMGSDTATANAAKSINALLSKYELDGVDFDYEYPYTSKEWNLYNNFLVSIKSNLDKGKLLSTAVGAWNVNFSKEAIDAIDIVQLMTYDIFDSHGYHAGFYSCMVNDLYTVIKKGIPSEKINLGLPFYSRPINKGGYWGDYFRFYNEGLIKSKYTNIVHTYPVVDMGGWPLNDPEYFNGYQMIADKTAFAIDTPVAGVMIWHLHCDIDYDNDLSLFGAIHSTLGEKGATLATK